MPSSTAVSALPSPAALEPLAGLLRDTVLLVERGTATRGDVDVVMGVVPGSVDTAWTGPVGVQAASGWAHDLGRTPITGAAHPMGPLALILIGLDVTVAALESMAAVEDDPRSHPAGRLTELLAAGRLGRESGAGFHTHRARMEIRVADDLVDPRTAADPAAAWTALISRYYDGCTTGDVELMLTTLHPDVVDWFLAPNTGSDAVTGGEHLARYWRKVTRMLQARQVVDSICATPGQAVIEWTMWWLPDGADERVATRGAEWFTCEDGLIREIRSYYQMRPRTTELDGFPYAERGYSVPGAERSTIHPAAERHPAGGGA